MYLKIGDIKKFKRLDGYEIIGVVINITLSNYIVYTLMNETVQIPKNTEYTSVRLEPKIRDSLEQIGESCKEEVRLKETLKRQEEKTKENMKKVSNAMGILSSDAFNTEVYKNLSDKFKKAIDLHKYNISFSKHSNTFELIISKSIGLGRINEGSFNFIGMEYDRTLFIYRDSPEYLKVLSKYTKDNLRIKTISNSSNYLLTEYSDMHIGDKDYLDYTHDIRLTIYLEKFNLTKENARNIAKLFSVC